jgi:lipoprotein-releasing system ATP-binding protein
MIPGLVARLPRGEIEARARGALDEVGLSHRLEHRPGELSGGEQQRVALARALVMRPKLLMADEPTGNLDSKMSEEVHQLFFQVNRRHGTTMLVVTHNAELASRMPRQLRMVDGIILEDRRTCSSSSEGAASSDGAATLLGPAAHGDGDATPGAGTAPEAHRSRPAEGGDGE